MCGSVVCSWHASGGRQGLRARLRPRPEGLQSRAHPDAAPPDQSEEGARRRPGLGAHLVGRGPRPPRGQAQRHPGHGPHRRERLPEARRHLRLGRHRAGLSRHLRRAPGGVGARWTRGIGSGQGVSATTPSISTASSGTAPSRWPPTCRAATTSCPSATTATPRAASPASSATPKRGRGGFTGCSSSLTCRSRRRGRRSGCPSSPRPTRPCSSP